MRPDFLSKNKNNVYRSQDEYFPTFIKGQKANGPFNLSKKLKHIRSSSDLLEEGNKNILKYQTNNQQHFLPKIGEILLKQPNFVPSKSIDQLQVYVHHLLLKNLKQHKENRQIKSIEKQIDKKKVDLTKKEEQSKKEKESNRLQQLRIKLTQLYGEMTLEQNKLKIQYIVQQKMEKKFTNLYEHIAKRFKRTDMVDTAQNTQVSTNPETKNAQKSVNSKKILSKFRVIGYVVVFSLLFPKYSNSFRSQRKKHFDMIIYQQKSLQLQLNNCHKLFEEIKLKSFWKKLQNKNGQSLSSITSQSKSLSSNNSSEQQINLPNEIKIFQTLKFIIQNILKAIKLGKIDQLIKILSLSLSNRSYITDSLFLCKQLKNMNVDKNNNFLLLKENQQKNLIANLLITKLTAFSFMMNNSILSKNNQQYIFQTKQNTKYQNISFTIAKHIQRAGLYLIDLCNKITFFDEPSLQSQNQGNLKELQKQLLPLPMPQLKIEDRKIGRSNKSLDKRTSIQHTIKFGDIIQEGVEVLNCENIRKKMKTIPKDIQNNLLQLINNIREEVYVKLKDYKRNYYKQLSQKAYKQIRNKEKSQVSQNKHSRSPQQLQKLSQLHQFLNKNILKDTNIILQEDKQDEISQKLNDSQQQIGNNSQLPSKQSQQNESKGVQSQVQSR